MTEIVINETGFEVTERLTLKEAAREIKSLDDAAMTHTFAVLVRKFRIGGVVFKLDVPRGERMKALSELSVLTGIHENQLRMWHNAYGHFHGDETKFLATLEQMGKPSEYKVAELIGTNTDPKVLGKKRLAERTIARVENLGRDLELIAEFVQTGVLDSDTANGVISQTYDAIRVARDNDILENLEYEETKIPRDLGYLQRVRELPCCVTGGSPVEAHHVEVGGQGIKGSDYSAIPLTTEMHREYHNIGPYKFEEKYRVSLGALVAGTMHRVLFNRTLLLP